MSKKLFLLFVIAFLSVSNLFSKNFEAIDIENVECIKIYTDSRRTLPFVHKEYVLSDKRDIQIFLSVLQQSQKTIYTTLESIVEGYYEIEICEKGGTKQKYKIISGGNYLKEMGSEQIYRNDRIYFYIQQIIYASIIKDSN